MFKVHNHVYYAILVVLHISLNRRPIDRRIALMRHAYQ